jgi:glycosyltransferase involved in cell wall biosynthesis
MPLPPETKPAYLFVLPWTLESLGGVSQVVENLINQMEIHGEYAPLLLVNSWTDKKIRKQKIKGRVHYFIRLRSVWNAQKRLKNLLAFIIFLPTELYCFHKFVKNQGITSINVHYCGLYAFNISILKMLRLFQGKFILSFHGKDILAARQAQRIEKFLWKILLRSTDTIVACSESLKNNIAALDKRCLSKINVIHNGIDISFMEQERDKGYRPDEPPHGGKFILNVGSFDPIKGQDLLILAFSKIAEAFPEVQLVMIGRQGEAIDKLEKLIHSLGLARRIWLYHGLPHDKLAVFYKDATVFALSSRFESFGIVILEAGAFGVPVVAADVGGIGEILAHDQTGRLCEPENSDCLARELIYLLEHPEERERLGNNLRKHVLQNFSWERAYRKYIECLRAEGSLIAKT